MKIKLYARNIVNNDEVKKFLKEISKDITVPEVKKWINSNLKNYIQEDLDTVTKVTKFKESDPQWLKDSVESGTALEVEFEEEFKDKLTLILQYFNSDEVELNKISKLDFEIAFSKATTWDRKIEEDEKKKQAEIPEDFTGIEVVREYSDKYKWVRLKTQKALDREGHIMNHCTKDEKQGYLDGIKSGKLEIFSLRDEKNIPHCTMEVRKTEVKQIKGYSNGAIRQQYVKKIKDFIKKPIENRKFEDIRDLKNIGILEQDGKWYNVYNLQPGFTVKGTLNLYHTTVEKLPVNLTVEKDLNLRDVQTLITLPKNLTVNGGLLLEGTLIDELPENSYIGFLHLYNTDIKVIPKTCKIGKLFIDSPYIDEFPSHLSINSASLNGSNVEKLPDNLKLKELDLTNSSVKELPENLSVDKLILCKSKIKKLPDNLNISEELDFEDSTLEELPENLSVTKLRVGNLKNGILPNKLKIKILYIDSSNIKKLPDNLNLDKLVISSYTLTELPKGLTVKELYLNNRIKVFPKDIKVEKLYLNTPISNLPKGIKEVIID